jgi:RHS repeat-associated protein
MNTIKKKLSIFIKRGVESTAFPLTTEYYTAELTTATAYYAFGSQKPEMTHSVGVYRFGFNGKEKDKEYGAGGLTQDYGFRMYNPALGKFLSVDPLTASYPWYTPYQFAGNKPIWAIDLDGLEPKLAPSNGLTADLNVPIYCAKLVLWNCQLITTNLMKGYFNSSLVSKFIDNYSSGNGEKITLSKSEMEYCNIYSINLKVGRPMLLINRQIQGLQPGESKEIDIKASSGGAKTSGTLGGFTLHIKGKFTMGEMGEFDFKGKMQFLDEWNFDPETEEQAKIREEETGFKRSESGEFKTKFASETLQGTPFDIDSEWIEVSQNSKENEMKCNYEEPKP